MFGSGKVSGLPEALFPPEFRFNPQTGAGLIPSARRIGTWVPPFGSSPKSAKSEQRIRGLRQCASLLRLSGAPHRRPDGDADLVFEPPPPGDYEFISAPFACSDPVLLAYEPGKGAVLVQLPSSLRWSTLEDASGGVLAESHIGHDDWRCEVAVQGCVSRLFVPTEAGLACITPDAPALSYSVAYLGNAPAVGAPILFDEFIWAPLADANGSIHVVGVDAEGRIGPLLEASMTAASLGTLHSPVTFARGILWPCDRGQLMVRKRIDGGYEASFLPWPENLMPKFAFGCPYLSREGDLWQLCLDTRQDQYVYLKLGIPRVDIQRVSSPRTCSGTLNFRFAAKFKNEPWVEPEHGDDGAAGSLMIPLLEAPGGVAVVGVKIDAIAGFEQALESTERVRALLVLDGDAITSEFATIAVSEPLRTRMFVHDGHLFAYHPLLRRIEGWRLDQ